MKDLFSISEMSQIFSISKATLRFYDTIGLFNPAKIDKQNGYRYYSPEQFEKISTIIYLSLLKVPLKEIIHITSQMNLENYFELLERQSKSAEESANKLLFIKKQLDTRMEEINEALHVKDINLVTSKFISERKIVSIQSKISNKIELMLAINELVKITASHFDKVEFTILKSDLLKGEFGTYNSIFTSLDKCSNQQSIENITTIPSGEFACVYYRESHVNSAPYYKMVLDYIQKNDFQVSGDAIRRVIVGSGMSKNNANFLTEIQIPITLKSLK